MRMDMRVRLEAVPNEALGRLFPAAQRPGARTSRAELAPLLHLLLRGARESLLKIKREGYVNKIIERSDLPLTAAERAGTTAGLAVRFADQHTFYSFVAKICNCTALLTEAEAEAGQMELLWSTAAGTCTQLQHMVRSSSASPLTTCWRL